MAGIDGNSDDGDDGEGDDVGCCCGEGNVVGCCGTGDDVGCCCGEGDGDDDDDVTAVVDMFRVAFLGGAPNVVRWQAEQKSVNSAVFANWIFFILTLIV